jgi:hypothetical protein
MRTELFAMLALAVCGAGSATFETGIARPGGAYQTLWTESATGCAAACDADGLCIAWSYASNDCELKAVAPQPVRDARTTSGLSARAPDFARALAPEAPPELRADRPPAPAQPSAMTPTSSHDHYGDLLGAPRSAPNS